MINHQSVSIHTCWEYYLWKLPRHFKMCFEKNSWNRSSKLHYNYQTFLISKLFFRMWIILDIVVFNDEMTANTSFSYFTYLEQWWNEINLWSAEIYFNINKDTKGVFRIEIFRIVFFNFCCFIWIYMKWSTAIINAGFDFRRQILTSIDARIWRLKSIPAMLLDLKSSPTMPIFWFFSKYSEQKMIHILFNPPLIILL